MPKQADPATKTRLLDAAEQLMLQRGFAATTVDEICEQAGLTKGSFFHYYGTKNDIVVECMRRFFDRQQGHFRAAPYRALEDPLDRVLGFVDLLIEFGRRPGPVRGCLVGTIAQEMASSHEEVRSACAGCFGEAAADLASDLRAAKERHAPAGAWSPESVAELCLAVLQGSLILAKAGGGARPLADNASHLKSYIETLCPRSARRSRPAPRSTS